MDIMTNITKSTFDLQTKRGTCICRQCGNEFYGEYVGYPSSGGDIWLKPNVCADCDVKMTSDAVIREGHLNLLKTMWVDKCPEEYRDTKEKQFDATRWHICLKWLQGMTETGRGLILGGAPRKRKTRMAWMLLKRIHFRELGKWQAWLWSSWTAEHAAKYSRSFDGSAVARDFIRSTCQIPILFLDDISHDNATERSICSLKEILEERTKHRRPTIITINASGDEFVARLKPEIAMSYGEAIRGRIRDYFDKVAF